MRKVEFGSVRFFRRLITLTVIIIITGLTAGIILVLSQSGELRKEIDELEGLVWELRQSAEVVSVQGEAPDYQPLYPHLYVSAAEEFQYVYDDQRFFYLTFVGGPSRTTEDIMEVLAETGIKATFFVSGGDKPGAADILRKISQEGHSVGVYSGGGKSNEIYASVESYLADFNEAFTFIYEATGKKPDIFRFKNGTINKDNVKIREELTAEMLRRGFTYYDWNSTAGDGKAGATAQDIRDTALSTAQGKQRIFMLLHDREENGETVSALPDIIEYYQEKGYTFQAITNTIRPVAFD